MYVEPAPPIPAATRTAVLERTCGRCEDCDVYLGRRLEMHHRHYNTVGDEAPEDLDGLCRECHHDRHVAYGVFWADPEELEWFEHLLTADYT